MDKILNHKKRLKKYNANRLTAWLLAVLMLFSALPTGNITVQAETTTNVAQIGSNNYTSWEEAIKAANDEDTITLLANIDLGAEASITPGKAVTIDLNGYSLKAATFIASGAEVVDSSTDKTGVLKVTNFVPAANNSQMPIYNGADGYVFATMVEQVHRSSEMGADTFELIFKPYFGTATMNGLLANGSNVAQVNIGIRLEWTDANGKSQSKDLTYTDEMVKAVYTGTNKAFYIEASGTTKFDDLTITPFVKSNKGAEPEWSDSKFDCTDYAKPESGEGVNIILKDDFEDYKVDANPYKDGNKYTGAAITSAAVMKVVEETTENKVLKAYHGAPNAAGATKRAPRIEKVIGYENLTNLTIDFDAKISEGDTTLSVGIYNKDTSKAILYYTLKYTQCVDWTHVKVICDLEKNTQEIYVGGELAGTKTVDLRSVLDKLQLRFVSSVAPEDSFALLDNVLVTTTDELK